jgi:hypothetical protein
MAHHWPQAFERSRSRCIKAYGSEFLESWLIAVLLSMADEKLGNRRILAARLTLNALPASTLP